MKKYKLCAFLFLIVIFLILIVSFISGYFSDRVRVYMKNKSTNYISELITATLNEEVVNTIDSTNMIRINYTNENVINSISVNTKDVNTILRKTNEILLSSIKEIDDISLSLPISIIFSDTLFNGMGPDMNFSILVTSSFNTDIVSNIEEFGINNSLFKLSIKISFTVDTIMPLNRDLNEIILYIPLVVEVITGEVPRYYYNTNDIIPDVYE